MRLTERVLALHDGICEAFLLEERAGLFVVAEEATRDKAAILTNSINEMTRNGTLAPAVILGAATQFSKTPSSLRLVGILYGDVGIMFAYVNENKLLAISTEPSSFSNAMQLVNDALPGLIKEIGRKTLGAVKSVVDAGEIARAYVAKTSSSSRVFINEITYRAANHRWEVHGLYRSSRVTPSKEFQLEVDGDDGAIMSFWSSLPSSLLLFAYGVVALLAALSLVAWLLYSNLLMR
jgi:hypothetical protein